MVKVTGEATFDDYRRARQKQTLKYEIAIAVILLGLSLYVAIWQKHYVFLIIVLIYLLIGRPYYNRFKIKRDWREISAGYRGEKTYQFDEAGFHTTNEEGKPAMSPWGNFRRFRESKETFYLYFDSQGYIFIPKRLMETSEQDALRELLRNSLGKKAKAMRADDK